VKEIKTVSYVPLSHPFVERLIGTIRREYLDQTLLDGSRSGGETPSLSAVFQSTSYARWLGRAAARTSRNTGHVRLRFIPLAAALSRTISDTYCRVIAAIRQQQVLLDGNGLFGYYEIAHAQILPALIP